MCINNKYIDLVAQPHTRTLCESDGGQRTIRCMQSYMHCIQYTVESSTLYDTVCRAAVFTLISHFSLCLTQHSQADLIYFLLI